MWVMTSVISSCVTPLAIARDRCEMLLLADEVIE
jgi:hypothetical protein